MVYIRDVKKNTEDIELLCGWLVDPRVSPWLDFGNGQQQITPRQLELMVANPNNAFKIYCLADDTPIGVSVIGNVKNKFGIGSLWGARGNMQVSNSADTLAACLLTMQYAFEDLKLHGLSAWAVSINKPSIKLLTACGFKLYGQQRACHQIDNEMHDRLHFDLLADEFFQLNAAAEKEAP